MDGEVFLMKNLSRLFMKDSYQGSNQLFLRHPALYHLAIYNGVVNLGASRVLEDVMRVFFHRLSFPENFDDDVVELY